MIAALLVGVSMAGGQADGRRATDVRVLGDDEVGLAVGARAGLGIGTVELYGGVDPFEAATGSDPSGGPLAGGVRAYLPLPGPFRPFGAIDATPWGERGPDTDLQLHRRAVAAFGVRGRPMPFSYDVAVGPGVWTRRSSGSGRADAFFALTVQAALGLSF